jgi:hypothetical protein
MQRPEMNESVFRSEPKAAVTLDASHRAVREHVFAHLFATADVNDISGTYVIAVNSHRWASKVSESAPQAMVSKPAP